MISVMVILPNTLDATSFYRGAGPLNQLRRSMSNLILTYPQNIHWPVCDASDALFIQRPYKKEHLKTIEIAKASRQPVWVDYDDFLFDIPNDNPCHNTYMESETQRIVASCIALADVVTVSTSELKRQLQRPGKNGKILNERIYVLPNAYNSQLLEHHWEEAEKTKRSALVSWRGSQTHQADLFEIAEPIVDTSRKFENTDWCWQFIGYHPWFLTKFMPPKKTFAIAPMDILDYHQFMTRTGPAIQFVSLHDHVFNHCKSNIAWIEGTMAGAVTIAPDWPEWRQPGVITYQTPDEFKSVLENLMADPKWADKVREMNAMSRKEIREKYLLSQVTVQRRKILGALIECEDWPEDIYELQPEVMTLE